MRAHVVGLFVVLILNYTSAARAANGINVIAVGFEANAMGGADAAVARDPLSALNSNPAGLAQLDGLRFENQGMILRALDVSHADALNGPRATDNPWIVIGNLGVSQSLRELPVTIGASLAAQGGVGVVFKELQTAFGARDELMSLVRIAKGTVGAGVQATDRLSLGAGLTIFYADAHQKLFPETSAMTSSGPFIGTEIRDASALDFGFKLGSQYRLNDALTFGVSYTSRTDLTFSGNNLTANFTTLGLGKVRYRDVTLTGLNQPQQVEIGAAWQATEWLLLALDLAWANWSSAVRRGNVAASDPDNAAAPATLNSSSTLGWRDQYVAALGAAARLDPATMAYAGLNLATNPVPKEHASPLLGGWTRTHITGGLARQVSERLRLGIGFEYLPNQSISYNNPELPFLANSRDTSEYIALMLGLAYRW